MKRISFLLGILFSVNCFGSILYDSTDLLDELSPWYVNQQSNGVVIHQNVGDTFTPGVSGEADLVSAIWYFEQTGFHVGQRVMIYVQIVNLDTEDLVWQHEALFSVTENTAIRGGFQAFWGKSTLGFSLDSNCQYLWMTTINSNFTGNFGPSLADNPLVGYSDNTLWIDDNFVSVGSGNYSNLAIRIDGTSIPEPGIIAIFCAGIFFPRKKITNCRTLL